MNPSNQCWFAQWFVSKHISETHRSQLAFHLLFPKQVIILAIKRKNVVPCSSKLFRCHLSSTKTRHTIYCCVNFVLRVHCQLLCVNSLCAYCCPQYSVSTRDQRCPWQPSSATYTFCHPRLYPSPATTVVRDHRHPRVSLPVTTVVRDYICHPQVLSPVTTVVCDYRRPQLKYPPPAIIVARDSRCLRLQCSSPATIVARDRKNRYRQSCHRWPHLLLTTFSQRSPRQPWQR